MNKRTTLLLAGMWTLGVAWCQWAGWLLGTLGWLNRGGYVALLVPGVVLALWFLRCHTGGCSASDRFSVKTSRFSSGLHLFQTGFCLIAALILIGALINPPFGWDAYGYRIPRVLRWLQEEHWHWLQSGDSRLDISSVVNEWQLAPILALFRSDRLIFLINYLPFLLFPGLLYLASRQAGVSRRWASFVMWIVPLGYCFSLEAGGVQNDGVAGIHAIAALAFLLPGGRYGLSKGWSASLALINISLMCGMKLSNAPLAAALFGWWLWSLRGGIGALLATRSGAMATAATCLICSIVPVVVINKVHEGAWSGDAQNRYKCEATNYVAAPIVNAGYLLSDALTPNPVAPKMNAKLAPFTGSFWAVWLKREHSMARFMRFSSLAYEGASGPGYPVLIAVPLCLACAWFGQRGRTRTFAAKWLLVGALLAFTIYLMKMASPAAARIAAAYIPVMVVAGVARATASGWRPSTLANLLAFISSGVAVAFSLVFTTSRPILPRAAIRAIDRHANDSYELHRYSSQEIGRFAEHRTEPIYFVVHWGAIVHRLYAPYRDGGTAVEVGSSLWSRERPKGRGLLAFTEHGIRARYSMTVEAFLTGIGATRRVDQDRDVPAVARENSMQLYEVPDLSRIPEPLFERTYVSDYQPVGSSTVPDSAPGS